eukprot:CAMPEP_0202708132 /NCGR_PEP_ID=MMETSP1385-20130828/20389_1 /ASSEMBLY_ACC=CAM_ASM_000861 /TAXON_ID=933848 /ORGANISM="Elphidium margaritaceum" /LENGTH=336 /DNA_ID=CAMNT_0049367031 /DNA_START=104 /DNA_END=1114 /DNA_ORIENTATION=-
MAEMIDRSDSEAECELRTGAKPSDVTVEKLRVSSSMKKFVYIGVVLVSLGIGFAVGILFLKVSETAQSNDGATEQQQNSNAFDAMNLLRGDILSKDDNDTVREAFNVFDKDGDESLDQMEFAAFLELQMNSAAQFETLDADGDGILSYPEAVTFVKQTNEINAVLEQSLHLVDVIAQQYGFQYKNESELALYLEYLAILMYFEQFDVDVNGYIHREEFINILAQNEFGAYDVDNDGEISFNDFYDILYGDDSFSWNGHLHDVFGDHTDETMDALAAVSVTKEDEQATQIQLCPIHVMRAAGASHSRRRLLRDCTTTCGYKYVNGESQYYCEVTCTW